MNTNLNMQTMPIDRLKPAKYNPRKDLKPGDPAYEKINLNPRKIQSYNDFLIRTELLKAPIGAFFMPFFTVFP